MQIIKKYQLCRNGFDIPRNVSKYTKKFKQYLLNEYILKDSLINTDVINTNENGNFIPIKYILYNLQNNISYRLILSSTKDIYNLFDKYNKYADISNKLFEYKYNKIEISTKIKHIFNFLHNITINVHISEEIILKCNTEFKSIIDSYINALSDYLLDTAIKYCNILKSKYTKDIMVLTRKTNINDTLYDLQYEIYNINSFNIFNNMKHSKKIIENYLSLHDILVNVQENNEIEYIWSLYSHSIKDFLLSIDNINHNNKLLSNTSENIKKILEYINNVISEDIKKIKYLEVFSNNYIFNYYDIIDIYNYIFNTIKILNLNMTQAEINYKHAPINNITKYNKKLEKYLIDKFTVNNQNHLKKLIMHMCISTNTTLIIKLDEINPDNFRLQNLMEYANSIDLSTFLTIDLEINEDLNKITNAIQDNIYKSNTYYNIEIKLQNIIKESNNNWEKNINDVKDLTKFSDGISLNIIDFISHQESIKIESSITEETNLFNFLIEHNEEVNEEMNEEMNEEVNDIIIQIIN